jgi:excisionase family DNA binding protein
LLSGKAAAAYLGVPYNTLRGWANSGTLPLIRVPHSRSLWFDLADLDQFIDRHRETGPR